MMMKPPVDLLSTPGFFLCEKSSCILRTEICIKRQRVSSRLKDTAGSFAICYNCEQGKLNKSSFNEIAPAFIQKKNHRVWGSNKVSGLSFQRSDHR